MNYLMAHLVGDYLLQNDWQALNKKKRSFPCFVHCSLYTLAVWLFTGWGLLPLSIVFIAHFIQDRTGIVLWYMAAIGQEKFATGPCSPWSIIVVDNVFHLLLLYAIDAAAKGTP